MAFLSRARKQAVFLVFQQPAREEHRLAAGLSKRQAGFFVDAVIAMAEPVYKHFLWRPQLRDPNNEMVLETAVNGGAGVLVTFNVKDFESAGAQFGVETLLPRDALRRMMQ